MFAALSAGWSVFVVLLAASPELLPCLSCLRRVFIFAPLHFGLAGDAGIERHHSERERRGRVVMGCYEQVTHSKKTCFVRVSIGASTYGDCASMTNFAVKLPCPACEIRQFY
jgi:hypothetical protein